MSQAVATDLPFVVPTDYRTYPLRELFFDDANQDFFAYVGTWHRTLDPNWPGGARNNTVTFRNNVQPGEDLRIITRRFPVSGTAEEGLILWGAAENTGPVELYLDGQFVKVLGGYYGYYSSLLASPMFDLRKEDGLYAGVGSGYMTPGWHTVTLVKPANVVAGDPATADRATYFDGATLFTRHPSFT